MSPDAAPTPVPIHDIVGPIAFFPYPIWMVVAAAAGALALVGVTVWFIASRRRPARQQSPSVQALSELARLRGQIETSDPYPFSIAVSDVLRVYLRDARGLSATTQTSREFLDAVRLRRVFNEDEAMALSGFLEKADLIKFARMQAEPADCSALLDQAERLVRSRGAEPETVSK